jgi:Beta-lactamase enzyme family
VRGKPGTLPDVRADWDEQRAGGRRRAVARVLGGVLAVAVALAILYLAFRGPSGKPAAAVGPATSSGPQPATAGPGGTPVPAHAAGPAAAGPGNAAPGRTSPASRPASPAASSPGQASPLGAARSYLSGRSGTVMAAVYDLRTGHEWTVGQGNAQAEASIVKLDILEALLAQRPPGGLPANDAALARKMIEDSDNDAATALWGLVGGGKGVATYNAQAGLARTTPSACVQCPGFPWPGWGLTTTTPHDQITLLRQLFTSGGQLTSADRQYALSLLENVTPSQRWGVTGGVPSGVTVALKNGWLPLDAANSDWQINSVGWVCGDGRDYLMAMLSTGNPSEQYGIATLNALGSMVWKALG